MRWIGEYLRDLREGCRILASRDFWRAFAAFWSVDAVHGRVQAWIATNVER